MNRSVIKSGREINNKLQWLILFRLLFSSLLLSAAAIVLQFNDSSFLFAESLLMLYGITAGIFFLSLCYLLLLFHVKNEVLFAYIQIIIDTFIVTLLIFSTGGFASIFLFLYLVVIIYSSMFLYRRGSLIVAVLCSIQYGIMIDLEHYGFISPYFLGENLSAADYDWNHVLYKVLFTFAACFCVAYLSSLLSEQAKESKKELLAMEEHVKRVEKLAAIGEMGAGLAHELKNPLASLTGSIQLLREDLHHDSRHDRLIQIVMREANRLSTLAHNFLMFVKPPAGKVIPIELDKNLSETIELFNNDKTCIKRISITNELLSGIWVEMDPAHLRQILWNLLLNAAESIEGEGFINIQMHPVKNSYVAVRISDNGCGMSEDTTKSIFDPFYTTKQTGTGLGLSIVQNILKLYDSRLDVESKLGCGTTFTLRLKIIDPPVYSKT